MTTTDTTPAPLITDEQRLTGAATHYGHAIPTYDDGSGPLWVFRDSMGIQGITRADSWESAWEICEDEFFPEASETAEEILAEYGKTRESLKIIRPADGGPERPATLDDYPLTRDQFVRWETKETPVPDDAEESEKWEAVWNNALFQEAFGTRPNGPRAGNWENGEPRDPIGHGFFARDLNGEALDELTPELAAALEITVSVEDY
jgi:hypothetical protein